MASNEKPKKPSLDDLLAQEIPQGPIQRGPGMRTSFDDAKMNEGKPVILTQDRTDAETQNRTNAIVRINRGYKIREDYIKRCKQIALDEDRHLYEIMEEALEIYLNTHKKPEEF